MAQRARGALAAAVGLLGVVALACTSDDDTGSRAGDHLAPGRGATDVVVGASASLDATYGASFVDEGLSLVLQVMPAGLDVMATPDGRAVYDAAPEAELANGLTVRLLCGGTGTSASDRSDGGRPSSGDVVTMVPRGPLMVVWEHDGRVGTLVESASDMSACTPPEVAEGPLVDAAASLRWVDGAELRALADQTRTGG